MEMVDMVITRSRFSCWKSTCWTNIDQILQNINQTLTKNVKFVKIHGKIPRDVIFSEKKRLLWECQQHRKGDWVGGYRGGLMGRENNIYIYIYAVGVQVYMSPTVREASGGGASVGVFVGPSSARQRVDGEILSQGILRKRQASETLNQHLEVGH